MNFSGQIICELSYVGPPPLLSHSELLERAAMLVELNKRGKTRQEIQDSLKVMPFVSLSSVIFSSRWHIEPLKLENKHPAMARAVRSLKTAQNPNTTFLCLSNSNSVYISTILEVRLTDRIYLRIFVSMIIAPSSTKASPIFLTKS